MTNAASKKSVTEFGIMLENAHRSLPGFRRMVSIGYTCFLNDKCPTLDNLKDNADSNKDICASACDFQQCGILTSVD